MKEIPLCVSNHLSRSFGFSIGHLVESLGIAEVAPHVFNVLPAVFRKAFEPIHKLRLIIEQGKERNNRWNGHCGTDDLGQSSNVLLARAGGSICANATLPSRRRWDLRGG